MMYRFKFSGFSLIELMVTMAIASLLLALTGGLVIKAVDQQGALIEQEKVQQLFKQLSYDAFYSGHNISLQTEGHTITINKNELKKNVNFKYLNFSKNEYVINTNAHVKPGFYEFQLNNGLKKEVFIKPMFQLYEQQ
ncbi:type II secretion system protein [Pseudoalteromonas sp.]|uniref:type II secretion system protein n=1 Tax=Pseudoalteromonas sp. TaxID=53249 RepID=UPI003569E4AC